MLFNELKNMMKILMMIKKFFFRSSFKSCCKCFFPSPFEEAIVLTADGVGEWATTTVAIGKGNNLEIKKEIHFPHSLRITLFCFYLLYRF